MKFTPKKLLLKNGKEVIIRSAALSDASKLLSTVKEYINDSEYIPKLNEEFTLSLEEEEQWIKSFIEYPNSLLLIAEYEGQILGNINISSHQRIIMQHTAVIGMGILNAWRNSGLGTHLMQQAIAWAEENPILELLWLQVYNENRLGLGLYKKMGFQENGIIKNFFKHENRYYDNITMSLSLK